MHQYVYVKLSVQNTLCLMGITEVFQPAAQVLPRFHLPATQSSLDPCFLGVLMPNPHLIAGSISRKQSTLSLLTGRIPVNLHCYITACSGLIYIYVCLMAQYIQGKAVTIEKQT